MHHRVDDFRDRLRRFPARLDFGYGRSEQRGTF